MGLKLPTWNWSEARKQFELRLPGLLNTRRVINDKLQEATNEWRKVTRRA